MPANPMWGEHELSMATAFPADCERRTCGPFEMTASTSDSARNQRVENPVSDYNPTPIRVFVYKS